jgi:hypothetical protein
MGGPGTDATGNGVLETINSTIVQLAALSSSLAVARTSLGDFGLRKADHLVPDIIDTRAKSNSITRA